MLYFEEVYLNTFKRQPNNRNMTVDLYNVNGQAFTTFQQILKKITNNNDGFKLRINKVSNQSRNTEYKYLMQSSPNDSLNQFIIDHKVKELELNLRDWVGERDKEFGQFVQVLWIYNLHSYDLQYYTKLLRLNVVIPP